MYAPCNAGIENWIIIDSDQQSVSCDPAAYPVPSPGIDRNHVKYDQVGVDLQPAAPQVPVQSKLHRVL